MWYLCLRSKIQSEHYSVVPGYDKQTHKLLEEPQIMIEEQYRGGK